MKTIQPDLLNETIERLKTEFQPEEIYLFGSHAWGTPDEDSDVDLMVIVPSSDERPIRRDQRAQKCLGRLAMPADVLVRTRGEVNALQTPSRLLVSSSAEPGPKALWMRPTWNWSGTG